MVCSEINIGPEEGEEQKLNNKELKKLLKKKEKAERRTQMQDSITQKNTKLEEKQRKRDDKYKEKEKARLEKEMEEKKIQEEIKQKEQEEYEKWKQDFVVEKTGEESKEELSQSQSRLSEFINYIQSHKVVPLEDLASEFSIRVGDAIDRIKALEKDDRLSGILDDRGKYVFITPEEFSKVAELIKKTGRISKGDLVRECNKIIRLRESEKERAQMEAERKQLAEAMEKEVGTDEKK